MSEDAYVSIGTNLGDRDAHLALALRRLAELPETALTAVSPVFETDPVGPPPQGPFLNAVAKLRTELGPRALLDALLAIEREAGRVRSVPNAARSLDLDLLLHGERVLDEPGLTLPHPRLAERPFVLEPLTALAPRLVHPTLGEPIAALAARVRDPRAVRPLGACEGIGDRAARRRR
ncbi:MAG: 2-amino-4-hydroxy-6-hydroxymethyldihydropteridine diphosphokinase [Deltaproteobacteria bacterium]|nr:2-amino-4-hydroxy-6-hydroxymethyldihydropteridine diphosphokinase [Deltaproteobacteria bacterium]